MAHFVYSCNICTFPRYDNKNETIITTHSIIPLLQSFMQERVESLQCGSHFDHVGLGTQMQMTNVHHASLLLGLPPSPVTNRQQQLKFIRSWQPHHVCTTESTDKGHKLHVLYKNYSCHTCCNHTTQKIMEPTWNFYRASTLSQGFSAYSHKIFIRDITYQICQFPQSGVSPCVNLDLILWHLTSNAEIFYSVVGSILLKKNKECKVVLLSDKLYTHPK